MSSRRQYYCSCYVTARASESPRLPRVVAMMRTPSVAVSSFGLGVLVGVWLRHAALRARRVINVAPTSSTPGLSCSMCRKTLPPAAFNARQARRRAEVRKCTRCIGSYVAPPADGGSDAAPPVKSPPAVAASHSRAEAPADVHEGGSHDTPSDPLRLARKAETVLRGRTERVLLVLEDCSDDLNHVAVLRTCEAMGVYRVHLVESSRDRAGSGSKRVRRTERLLQEQEPTDEVAADAPPTGSRARRRLAARAAERGFSFDPLLGVRSAQLYSRYLDVRTFPDVASCVAALREDGREIWATDLAQEARPLTSDVSALSAALPDRLAIVLGSESGGISPAFLEAADRRVYLPMVGFTESFNLSVAAALVLQRLLDACASDTRGQLPEAELAKLRLEWYLGLARSEQQCERFASLAASGGAAPYVDPRRPEAFRDEKRRDANAK